MTYHDNPCDFVMKTRQNVTKYHEINDINFVIFGDIF